MFRNSVQWILLAAFAAVWTLAAQAQAPIKIGAHLSVTGPAAFLGDPELKTYQYYIEKINAAGGVLGRKLELVWYDDNGDPNKANAFAKRLIEEDKVDIMLGGSTTGTTMSVVPLVEKAGIPFISLAGAVVVIEPVKKWVFKTPLTDRMVAEKVFEDMKKRGLTKIGLLAENSAFGQSGKAQSHEVVGRYGIQIIADETYGPKDADVTAQLTKIKNTQGVQAIFVFGFGQGPTVVTRNYGQLGITLPHYETNGVGSEQYIKLSGKASEGVRLPALALLIADKLPDNDPQKPVVTAFKREYEARFKSEVSNFGAAAYDALMIAVDAIKRAGTADKAKVRDAIEQTKGLMSTGGEFTMSPTDHLGLDLSAFRMLEIRNGTWTLAK